MAEEWGVIAVKAPVDIRKSVTKRANDVTEKISILANHLGFECGLVDQSERQFDSISNTAGFIVIEYDGSEWVDFSKAAIETKSNVEYYARHGDEYGTSYYFSKDKEGKTLSICLDEEGDDEAFVGDNIKRDLGRWVNAIPKRLTKAFPDLNNLDPNLYDSAFTATKPSPKQNVTCLVKPYITKDQLLKFLHEEFHEFGQEEVKKKGDLFDLLFGNTSKNEEEQPEPEHAMFYWHPISNNRNRTVDELLKMISLASQVPIYAYNYFDYVSFPYKIFSCHQQNIECLLDTDEYEESDLKLISQFENQLLKKNVEWLAPDLEHLIEIENICGLRNYLSKEIKTRKHEEHVLAQQDLFEHHRIWSENADQLEPMIKGASLFVYYRTIEVGQAEEIAYKLQCRGMHKKVVEHGLGYFGKNSICVSPAQEHIGKWLQKNISELKDHRLVLDNDDNDDDVAINMS